MINYQFIADSVAHYQKNGFIQIEAPWTVSKKTSAITKPTDLTDYELVHNGKVLVASGEQSFLYMMTKGYLHPGKYQTVTPCFRDESFDMTHRKYFIKNELIVTDPDQINEESLVRVINVAMDFFSKYLPKKSLRINPVDNTYDIECKVDGAWHELGSYGIRRHGYFMWMFATGCAEPRLSQVIMMRKHGIPQN